MYIAEFWTLPVSWLTLSGIAWDISGAIALSRGWFFVRDEVLKRQASSYWGASPAQGRAFAETRLDTRFGIFQLLVGFVLQFFSAAGLTIGCLVAAFLFLAIGIAWLFFLYNYSYWVLRDGVRLTIGEDAIEENWRAHYPDVSDLHWRRVMTNEDLHFKYKTGKEYLSQYEGSVS